MLVILGLQHGKLLFRHICQKHQMTDLLLTELLARFLLLPALLNLLIQPGKYVADFFALDRF